MLLRIFFVAVLVTVGAVGPAATTATAAPNATNNTTTTTTPPPTTASRTTTPAAWADQNSTDQAVIRVGPHVTVADYQYQDGEFTVTLRADLPTLIVLSDVLGPIQDAGAREIPQKQVMLDQGKTTVTMEVGTYRGAAAISVATSDGAVYLSTGISPPNPFAGADATLGWFGGAGVGLLGAAFAAWRKKRAQKDKPIRAGEDD